MDRVSRVVYGLNEALDHGSESLPLIVVEDFDAEAGRPRYKLLSVLLGHWNRSHMANVSALHDIRWRPRAANDRGITTNGTKSHDKGSQGDLH